mmetsp:Transcript_27526/g.69689  ORF Transcript_27526/g.69689 Transcript_27526/m.69689 type:complete len:89 (+) Transcript_27526:263-529(+)
MPCVGVLAAECGHNAGSSTLEGSAAAVVETSLRQGGAVGIRCGSPGQASFHFTWWWGSQDALADTAGRAVLQGRGQAPQASRGGEAKK